MWYIRTMKYYLAIKRNEVLIHATTRMKLEMLWQVKEVTHTKRSRIFYDCVHMKCPEEANG